MFKFFVFFSFLIFFSIKAIAVSGVADKYEVTMKKVELCTSSACSSPTTVASGSQAVNIASLSAGAEAAARRRGRVWRSWAGHGPRASATSRRAGASRRVVAEFPRVAVGGCETPLRAGRHGDARSFIVPAAHRPDAFFEGGVHRAAGHARVQLRRRRKRVGRRAGQRHRPRARVARGPKRG